MKGAKKINKNTVLLLLIELFGMALSLSFLKGPSVYGDDPFYLQYVPSILNGTFKESINIFSLRLLLIYPISWSVGLLGYTDFAAGFYPLVSYLVLIALIYLIGKEAYSEKAGLFGALVFSFYPLVIKFNSDPDPMLPLSMFLVAATYFFLLGIKYRKHRERNYVLSGFLSFMSSLINPLAYIYVVFFLFYMVANLIYQFIKKTENKDIWALPLFILGLVTAVVVVGYINILLANGKPFYEFNMTNYYYSGTGGPDEIYYTNPSLTFYIHTYFLGVLRYMANLFTIHVPIGASSYNEAGLFGYAALIAAAYLIVRNDKRSRFLLIWTIFIAAYMEFGSMSITHYVPIYKLMRFTVIVAPPLSLVIGAAMARFASNQKHKKLVESSTILVLVLLFITSLPIDYYFYSVNHNIMLVVKTEANALLHAPNITHAQIYTPGLLQYYLEYYLHYVNTRVFFYDNGAYGGVVLPTCESIPNNSYIIIPSVTDIAEMDMENFYPITESWATNPNECGLQLYLNVYSLPVLKHSIEGALGYAGNIYYKP